MKCVVVQTSGLGDDPLKALNDKTPLEAARTPNLDRMAARGILGLTRTVPQGCPAAAGDAGPLAVLGYDPAAYRGAGGAVCEAASLDVPLGSGDVALRCNLVTREALEDGTEVMVDAAGGRLPDREARALVEAVAGELGGGDLELHAGTGYRHLLVWHGGDPEVRTTPPHLLHDRPVREGFPSGPGAERLRAIMQRSEEIFAQHPLCVARQARGERVPTLLWPWGPSRATRLPSMRTRYGVRGALVSAVGSVRGLGRLAGLEVMDVEGATGMLDSDYAAKVAAVLGALDDHDFCILHVAAADEEARRGDPTRKVAAIERVDEAVVGPLLDGLRKLGDEWRILVMGDQGTSCTRKSYGGDPVPFVAYVTKDDDKPRLQKRTYHERDAREQGIFIPEGHSLLGRMLRV
jgi:2,3-bisphosphoglycerate-independent phosphoglycerate mutase